MSGCRAFADISAVSFGRGAMTKLLGVAVVAIASVLAGSASAQTFVSTLGTCTFSGGAIGIQKVGGPVLTCSMSMRTADATMR